MASSPVAELICTALSDHGYDARESRSEGAIRVVGRTRQSWCQVLIRATPQRLVWLIESDEAECRVTLRSQYTSWYAGVVSVLSVSSLGLWYLAIRLLLGQSSAEAQAAPLRMALFLLSFCLVFVAARLLLSSGGSMITTICRTLQRTAQGRAQRFESVGSTELLSGDRYAICYTASVLTVAVMAAINAEFSFTQPIQILTLALALPLLAGLCSVIYIVIAIPGASERCAPMLPCFLAVFAFIVLLAVPLPAVLLGQQDVESWTRVTERSGRMILALPTLYMLTCIALSVGFFIQAVRICERVASGDAHVKAFADAQQARVVMEGSGYLLRIRYALSTAWIALSIALGFELIFIIRNAVAALIPGTNPEAVMATGWIFATVLGRDPHDLTVGTVAVVVWMALLLVALTPFAVLLGELIWRLGRVRWLAHVARREQSAPQKSAESLLGELLVGQDEDLAEILVVAGSAAAATVAGPGRRNRIILLGEDCIDALEPEEVRALIAHELAHHLHGDCIRHTVLRLLGRLTLLGDGFIAVLADSFRYEARADLTAVTTLGVDPRHLVSCLKKMAMLAAMERAMKPTGLALLTRPEGNQHQQNRLRHLLRRRLRLFWVCCTGDTKLGYWHPSMVDRIAQLEAMAVLEEEVAMT